MKPLIALCLLLLAFPCFAGDDDMTIDYAALATELRADPNGYGYAQFIAVGSFGELADLLNETRPEISVPRSDVTPLEILEAIALQDFLTDKTNLWSAWFESITQFPSLRILKKNGTDTRVMTNIMKLLVNGSASETRLRALSLRPGSRAEQLFGMQVTPVDVGKALGEIPIE